MMPSLGDDGMSWLLIYSERSFESMRIRGFKQLLEAGSLYMYRGAPRNFYSLLP